MIHYNQQIIITVPPVTIYLTVMGWGQYSARHRKTSVAACLEDRG